MTAVIAIDSVRKSFGAVTAVDDVSLEIEANEFVALLGASGCGKTTLLRMVAGFETPDSGRIVIDGADMSATPPYKRPINLMFQSYALFPHMTVRGNVAFGLKQEGLSGPELDRRIDEALDLVELRDLGARHPAQLSGGQQQRVALARCIAKRPRALLLDEPLAALDRALRERTRLELMKLRERLGISFIVVTHDQEDAMTMADRVAVMDAGKIAQVGTPRALYDAPATRLIASFFGESNVWDGQVSPCGRYVSCAALGLDVVTKCSLPEPGSRLSISVRPERIALDSVENKQNKIPNAVIEDVVFLGTTSTYLARTPTGGLIRISRQNTAGPGFKRGDQVSAGWAADAVVVLTS